MPINLQVAYGFLGRWCALKEMHVHCSMNTHKYKRTNNVRTRETTVNKAKQNCASRRYTCTRMCAHMGAHIDTQPGCIGTISCTAAACYGQQRGAACSSSRVCVRMPNMQRRLPLDAGL